MRIRLVAVFVLLSGVVAVSSPSAAQDSHAPKHLVGPDVGVTREADLDELASPLIYRSVFAVWGITYAYRSMRYRHRASFAYARPRMTSSISSGDQHVQEGWQLLFVEQSVFRVASFDAGAGGAFAGAGIDGRFRRRHHSYGGSYSEWLTEGHAALTVAAALAYRSVQIDVALPLGAYLVRSPYAVKGQFRHRWAMPLRGISVRASYERPWTRHAALHARYVLEAWRLDDPLPSSTLSHGLVAGIRWVR